MRWQSRGFAWSLVAVVSTVAVGMTANPVGALRPGRDVSSGRLENVEYQEGLLTAKDAKAFVKTTSVTPEVSVIGRGGWQPKVCDQVLAGSDSEVAGRSVQYDPTNEASMANFVAAFDSERAASGFMVSAKTFAAGCDTPYRIGTATFTPGTSLRVPKVGDQRVGFSGTFVFSNGQTANNAQIVLRDGQLVEYVNMLSVAPITPKIVTSVANAMGARLKKIESAAKSAKKRSKTKSKVASCEKVLTKPQLEKVFAVGLKDPDDCSYELATGAGGVDVGFTTVARGAVFTYAQIAKGEPVEVKGAADALYSTSTNQFGQVSETIYVQLPNGDMVRIGLRGDDVPKHQKQQLIAAAKVAVKNT